MLRELAADCRIDLRLFFFFFLKTSIIPFYRVSVCLKLTVFVTKVTEQLGSHSSLVKNLKFKQQKQSDTLVSSWLFFVKPARIIWFGL